MEYAIEYHYNERFMRKEQYRFKDNECYNLFVINAGESMWLLELQLDSEFKIKFEEHVCRSTTR